MAFSPKTWVGRVVQHTGRILATPTGNTNEFDVTRSEGTVTTAGDQLSPEAINDLESRILSAFTGTTVAGVPLNGSPTLAQLISAGLCPAPESGTWTPTIEGTTTAGSPTYTTQYGKWYKIGKLIIAYCDISISSFGGAAGIIKVGGYPFALVANFPALSTAINSQSAQTNKWYLGYYDNGYLTAFQHGDDFLTTDICGDYVHIFGLTCIGIMV